MVLDQRKEKGGDLPNPAGDQDISNSVFFLKKETFITAFSVILDGQGKVSFYKRTPNVSIA